MERKTKSTCRRRLSRAAGFLLSCLFAAFAPAAQAMLLELNFHWDTLKDPDHDNNVQVGSIIQVIAYNSTEARGEWSNTAGGQFTQYGATTEEAYAAPYDTGADHKLEGGTVYLADTTPLDHEIVYTGTLEDRGGGWYGLYTQISIDTDLYDTVYVRVFGASSIEPGTITASYWGVSTTNALDPTFYFQTYELSNMDVSQKDYFEVIPEPATCGLLGLGGCALAAWLRKRNRRREEEPNR